MTDTLNPEALKLLPQAAGKLVARPACRREQDQQDTDQPLGARPAGRRHPAEQPRAAVQGPRRRVGAVDARTEGRGHA